MDPDTGVCLKTLEGHNEYILKIHLNILFSCNDNTIKVWNLETCECERTLLGHSDFINKLIII